MCGVHEPVGFVATKVVAFGELEPNLNFQTSGSTQPPHQVGVIRAERGEDSTGSDD